MPRIANPVSPVRLWVAPPRFRLFCCCALKISGRFCWATYNHCISLDGEIGRHSGLKIRRFVHSGRTGSIPVRGTNSSFVINLSRLEPVRPRAALTKARKRAGFDSSLRHRTKNLRTLRAKVLNYSHGIHPHPLRNPCTWRCAFAR